VKLYLAGPMTGYTEHNFPAFRQAAERLRSLGYDVLSAHEVLHDGKPGDQAGLSWTRYLRDDLVELLRCDAIAVLPGWTASKGARLEMNVALGVEMPAFLYDPSAGHLVSMSWAPSASMERVE
jgi:hypothetical protein